jgi:putative DNA methylase
LALALDKLADYNNSICTWNPTNQNIGHLFTKQAIPMAWDFSENSPLTSGLSFDLVSKGIARTIELLPTVVSGKAFQEDCAVMKRGKSTTVISTDPPYYDNIGYADLSDFFYLWLRRSMKVVFPDLFATLAVPKAEELIATPHRHGNKEQAETFFLNGMTQAMHCLAEQAHVAFPVTIYYAFKQSETKIEGTVSVGWESFLEAVIRAGFAINGTWPMRTERDARAMSQGSNALASSIVLVCRKRPIDAPTTSRREFLRELNTILPEALDVMTKGSGDDRSAVAPVDLSQSIIGPGMAVFSKYTSVLEADGKPMTVRTALQLVNRFLAEDDFDHDTQFCLHWFESFGWGENKFGEADVLARAKGTTVDGAREAGVIDSKAGKVRLLKYVEYPQDWNPVNDKRTPVWEALHHLIRALHSEGEVAAGNILALIITKSESIRQLAYRLYTLCERKGWAEDARAYNDLITSWQAIESASNEAEKKGHQPDLFDTGENDVAKTLA